MKSRLILCFQLRFFFDEFCAPQIRIVHTEIQNGAREVSTVGDTVLDLVRNYADEILNTELPHSHEEELF